MPFRQSLYAGVFALAALGPAMAAEPVEIHFAPAENLERFDVALLRAARSTIDLAAYVLTDWPVIDALIDAHRRGVAIRVVLDPAKGAISTACERFRRAFVSALLVHSCI